jgi:exosortase
MRQTLHSYRVRFARVLPLSWLGRAYGNRSALVPAMLALLAITAWSYWPTMYSLFHGLQRNEDYSAGLIVPFLAAFLVWRKREVLGSCSLTPCWWAGAPLLLLSEACRTYGFLSSRVSAENYSLVLMVVGSVLMIAGWQVFRWVLWILMFLFLMVPLPARVHNLISLPLQSIATRGSVFLLEAFGTSVSRQGNIVLLNSNTSLGVAEACSGLRMLIAFIIAAALIAYLVKRPRWQKAILLVSSIPVAVICNVIRIFIMAILMLYVDSEVLQKFFHDISGFVMIAIAVSLLFGEIRLMDRLIVSEPSPKPGQVILSTRSE